MDHQRRHRPARRVRNRIRRRRLERLLLAVAFACVTPAAVGTGDPSGAAPASDAPSASQVRAGEWWLSEMGIQKAWSVTKGRGVVVGLLDSGVDASHPDLQNALTPGIDVSGKGTSNGEKPVDDVPHGTNMAGFIAGRGHDGAGMLGAAPEAKVMSVSTANSDPDAAVSRGFRYLVDHGAKVINISFGGGDRPDASDIAYAQAHDVVVVVATGTMGCRRPSRPVPSSAWCRCQVC